MSLFGGATPEKMGFSGLWLLAGLVCRRAAGRASHDPGLALATGAAVVAGWLFTYQLGQASFAPVTLEEPDLQRSVRRAADAGSGQPASEARFRSRRVPGVFLGSFLAAALARELNLEGFSDGRGMRRYLVGAVLMGFGAMLAGGCAVGAGVTGASVFALTAWIVLAGMWIGAAITDLVVDRWIDDARPPERLQPDRSPALRRHNYLHKFEYMNYIMQTGGRIRRTAWEDMP